MKRAAFFFLSCLLLLHTSVALASSQLDLHLNGMLATTDGEDAFFFTKDDAGSWHIETASGFYKGEQPFLSLGESEPFAMLYADAAQIWYACYSPEIRYEDEGSTWAAAELFRLDRRTGEARRIISDIDPQMIFPADGSSLYFVPWHHSGLLCKIDFITGEESVIAEIPQEIIWSATQNREGIFLLTLTENGGEKLYHITDENIEEFAPAQPYTGEHWLQGDFYVSQNEEQTMLSFSPLIAPLAQEELFSEFVKDGNLYRFGNALLSAFETEDGLFNLYYTELSSPGAIQHLAYDSPPYYFVMGYSENAFTVLDGAGRVLQVKDHFETLEQVAQIDMSALYDMGIWLWALPFDDYVLLLGYQYEDSFHHPGNREPPTIAKIVPFGSGMAEEDAVGFLPSRPDDHGPLVALR